MTNYRILRVVLLLLLGSLLVTRSVALEVVGSVGGTCPSVAAKDGYVYLCEGRGLTVLDARAAGDPVVIERVRLDAGTTCVRLDNDVAYVGTVDGKVRLYSLVDPASPSLLSTTTLIGGSLADAAFEGGHAFFANEGGVEIVDVSNPAAPVGVSRYKSPINPYDTYRRYLCVVGTRMYLTSTRNCEEVDVSDLTQPDFLANLARPDVPDYDIHSVGPVRASGSSVYIPWNCYDAGLYRSYDKLTVYRQVTGELTQLLARPDLSAFYITEVWGQDSKIYLLGRLMNPWNPSNPPIPPITNVFAAIDITDPQNIEVKSLVELPRSPYAGALDGTGSHLAVLDDSGLTKIELGQDDAMTVGGGSLRLHSPLTPFVTAGGFFAAAGKALVSIDGPTAPGLSYINESDLLSGLQLVSAAASGRFLYISNMLEGLDVRYITPEPTIARVATIDPLAWENVENPLYGGLAVAGETVWASFSTGEYPTSAFGLMAFDVSNPLHPVTLGMATRPTFYSSYPQHSDIAISGTRACVAGDELCFYDIANPSLPRFLSEVAVTIPDHRSRLFWNDDLVIYMERAGTLRVVNASDAANPFLLAPSSPLPGEGSLKWMENGRAYIATYRARALDVYRVVPGGEPVLLESLPSRGYILSVEMYGGHVYAMDSEDGLLVMKTNLPDHRAQRHLLGSDTGAADQNGDGVIDAADLVLAMAAARE